MRTVLKLSALALGLAATSGAATVSNPVPDHPVWVERETYLMGTQLRVVVAVPERAAGVAAIESAFAEVRRLEQVLSSWQADTEIGRINSAPVGEPVAVTAELWAMLEEARRWTERTGGTFDPGVGALMDAWEMRGAGRRPSAKELATALRATGIERFRFDAAARTVTRANPSSWLDTGGFGKGAALAAAGRVLRDRGVETAFLDFGGQLLAIGTPPEGGWQVGVAHPSRREKGVMSLRLTLGSVSTTSQSERYVEAAGERIGHVVDPRTGSPAPAWGSVTVVAHDPLVADILSTALFVMGPVRGKEWAAGLEEVGVLFLEERNGEVAPSWNQAFEQYRWITRTNTRNAHRSAD